MAAAVTEKKKKKEGVHVKELLLKQPCSYQFIKIHITAVHS